MSQESSFQRAGGRLKEQAALLGGFVSLFWLLEIIDILILNQTLNNLGIRPRTLPGLWGILLMPFLHGGLAHLGANTIPFLVLGWLVMLKRFSDFVIVSAVTLFVSGFGLWLFGSGSAVYIGASGLIFGYFGFLLLRGYFERTAHSILIAIFVALAYGGLILGILPQRPGISWEAHLFGFIGGILAARFLAQRSQRKLPAETSSDFGSST